MAFLFRITCIAMLTLISANYATASCSEVSDCVPPGTTVPSSSNAVQCNNGNCICNDCFELNSTSGNCTLNQCYSYKLGQCTDNAVRWLPVLLMSIMVGGTGAANFYINRLELAIPQLALFCLILTLPCIICCFYCFTSCDCGDKCKVFGLILNLVLALVLLIATFTLASWWIADLVFFSLNLRTDSRGCELVR